MPKPGTKQESPISASAEAKEILQRLSEALRVRKIDLLDHAVLALRDYVEHHGGRILLPLRFNETFTVNVLPQPGGQLVLHKRPAQSKSGRAADSGKTNEPSHQ